MSSTEKDFKCTRCELNFSYEQIEFMPGQFFPPPNHCPDCVPILNMEYEALKMEEQTRHRLSEWKNICPPVMQKTDLEHNDFNREKYDEVMKWSPMAKKPHLLMHGMTGTCKTRCFYALLRSLFVSGAMDIAVFAPGRLETAIFKAYKDNRYDIFYNKMVSVPILALDDLGKEKLTERYESFLFSVLNERFVWERSTVITTNFVGETLIERFNDKETATPLVRRLREYCHMIQF